MYTWKKMNLYHAQPSHDHDNVLASNGSEAESSPFKEKFPTVIVRALYYIFIYTQLHLLINYIYHKKKS